MQNQDKDDTNLVNYNFQNIKVKIEPGTSTCEKEHQLDSGSYKNVKIKIEPGTSKIIVNKTEPGTSKIIMNKTEPWTSKNVKIKTEHETSISDTEQDIFDMLFREAKIKNESGISTNIKIKTEPGAPKSIRVRLESEIPKFIRVKLEPETPKSKRVKLEPDILKSTRVKLEPESPKNTRIKLEPESPKSTRVKLEPETSICDNEQGLFDMIFGEVKVKTEPASPVKKETIIPYKKKYFALRSKCIAIQRSTKRLVNRICCVKKLFRKLCKEKRILMHRLDLYGDKYRQVLNEAFMQEHFGDVDRNLCLRSDISYLCTYDEQPYEQSTSQQTIPKIQTELNI